MHIDAGRGLIGELTLEGSIDTACEVDGLTAAGDLAEGVAVRLAPLAHDGVRNLILMLDDELAELEHDVHTLRQGGTSPFLLRLTSNLDDLVKAMLVGQSQLIDDLADSGVLNVNGLVAVGGILLAIDPQVDCHWFTFLPIHPRMAEQLCSDKRYHVPGKHVATSAIPAPSKGNLSRLLDTLPY